MVSCLTYVTLSEINNNLIYKKTNFHPFIQGKKSIVHFNKLNPCIKLKTLYPESIKAHRSCQKSTTKNQAFPIPTESILSYRSRWPRSRHNWVVLVKSLRRWLKSRRFLLRRKCFEDRKLSPLSDEMPARKWKGDLIMLIGLNVRTTRRRCKTRRLTLSPFSPFSRLSFVILRHVWSVSCFDLCKRIVCYVNCRENCWRKIEFI